MRFFSRAGAYLREHGWRVGFALAVHRLLGRFAPDSGLYWYRFYRQPLLDSRPARETASVTFRWLHDYDLLLAALPRPVENLRARFEQNVRCLVATREEELLGCAWFGFEQFDEDEVQCTFLLPQSSVWDFDVFVFPKYRIGRLFFRIWQEAGRALVAEGFTDSLSRISVYNNNSIRSHEKLGAEKVGVALFLKVGRVQLLCSSFRPFVSLSLWAQHVPSIDLRELKQ